MRKAAILFSHSLTKTQKNELSQVWEIESIQNTPENLTQIWKKIPPQTENLNQLLLPVKEWIENSLTKDDLLVVQGDHGATFIIVLYALKKGLIPVYATTKRMTVEKCNENGSIQISKIFHHVKFRRYYYD